THSTASPRTPAPAMATKSWPPKQPKPQPRSAAGTFVSSAWPNHHLLSEVSRKPEAHPYLRYLRFLCKNLLPFCSKHFSAPIFLPQRRFPFFCQQVFCLIQCFPLSHFPIGFVSDFDIRISAFTVLAR